MVRCSFGGTRNDAEELEPAISPKISSNGTAIEALSFEGALKKPLSPGWSRASGSRVIACMNRTGAQISCEKKLIGRGRLEKIAGCGRTEIGAPKPPLEPKGWRRRDLALPS